ncbi:MAG: helix-turn-helix domain-containing protein [Candidatus Aenigmatarchaeota archaeon]
MISQKILDALKTIGLNLYERKLWVAILARGTSTAGELSEIANVPRSRAYDVLQTLAEKGFVVLQPGKPIKYVAIPPEQALENVKKKLENDFKTSIERIEELKKSPIIKELNDIFKKGIRVVSPEEITGSIRGRYSIFQQLDYMFKNAKKKINIVTTPEGLNELLRNHLEILREAKERGVEIKIALNETEGASEAIKILGSLAEIRVVGKETPVTGRLYIVDGSQLIFGLTDSKQIPETQEIAFWSKSEYAASNVLEPLFDLVWNHSKELS